MKHTDRRGRVSTVAAKSSARLNVFDTSIYFHTNGRRSKNNKALEVELDQSQVRKDVSYDPEQSLFVHVILYGHNEETRRKMDGVQTI